MKRRTRLRFGKQAADQSTDDRAADAKQRRHYESEVLRARHDGACDPTDDETDDDTQIMCSIYFSLALEAILSLASMSSFAENRQFVQCSCQPVSNCKNFSVHRAQL